MDTGLSSDVGQLIWQNPFGHSGNVVGIATGYGLDGPGIESRWGRDFPHLSRPAVGRPQSPVQWVPGLSWGKEQPGVTLTPHPSSAVVKKEYSYTSTPPMGRTACTEPQCLYKGALLPLQFGHSVSQRGRNCMTLAISTKPKLATYHHAAPSLTRQSVHHCAVYTGT